jgi:hypothetical protein
MSKPIDPGKNPLENAAYATGATLKERILPKYIFAVISFIIIMVMQSQPQIKICEI